MDYEPEGDETLWDARDVARYLQVSRSWVYQKAEAGLPPYLKVGGLVRFVPERIREFALGSARGVNPGPHGLGNRLPGGR